jgi:FkbM family methyltransferase
VKLHERIAFWVTPPLVPLLLVLANTRGPLAIIPRKMMNFWQRHNLGLHGPASKRDFEVRLSKIGPKDICLDLGANMGAFTAKLAATGAVVHAYEPDPFCFAALEKRFAGQKNVHLHQQAVAHENGMTKLRRAKEFESFPELYSEGSSIVFNDASMDDVNTIDVQMRSFVDVVRQLGQPVAIVKMDIEGAEFAILDQLLADQARNVVLPIGAMFVETHERFFPDRLKMVCDLRRRDVQRALPYPIDTYWP